MKLQQKLFILFILSLIPLNIFAGLNLVENSKWENSEESPVEVNWYAELLQQVDSLDLKSKKEQDLKSDTIAADSTAPKPFFETAIDYNADDSVTFSLTGQKVFLTKNAFVKYGSIELKAYYIELDIAKKEAFAYGIQDSTGKFIDTPEFKDGTEEFACKQLRYNFDTGKGLVNEIITEQESGYVHSEFTKRMDENTFFLKNGKYTTCDHEHPHFYVKMTKAKMIKDDKIVSGPLYLVLEDVPLPVFLPFGFFPFSSKYSSGILLPSYGEEQLRGFNLRGLGYYWAINDYVDLATRFDIFSNGSWGTDIDSKYKKRYKFSGSLSGEYHKNQYGDKGLDDYSESTDFAIRWTHTQDSKANPYRTFSASVNFSTSENDRNNSTDINKIVNNQKQSSISYSKKWPDSPFSLNGSLRHSQNSIDTTISLTLPSLSLNMTQIYPFRSKGKSSNLKWYDKVGVSYSSKLENRINTKEDELMSSSLTKDWQNGYQHSIPITTNFKLATDLTLSPTLNYKGVLYSKSIRKSWDESLNDNAGGVLIDTIQGLQYAHNYSTSVSLSLSPKIYGMYTFKESSKIEAIRHVMTPSISVGYTPEIGIPREKYYKTYKNGDGDDVEYSMFEGSLYGTPTGALESGSISLSLDNNIEAKIKTANDTTGNEDFKKVKILESLKFSTSYNMFADSLNWSTIRISGRTKLFNNKLDLSVSSTVDPYDLNANDIKIDKFGPRMTNASIDLGFGLSSTDFKGEREGAGKGEDGKDGKKNEPNLDEMKYIDFDIPWSFTLNYGWTYSKPKTESNTTQNVSLRGNFSLTPKWKITFSTGYDFADKSITATQFSLTRDLHCWQMTFNTIPFGTYQSYNFKINVLSSVLQDLKYEKKKVWQDY
ncbi:putative LPS assembly protein LptD [Ancylomarina sp. 16SWW S1-10-2]|uniref:putative LPS assembly protein LptD n=1 Tax=Ancylomarina sp. 16SWW S1-10-2 TaxID=2499681 RepID=UPI0012AE3912|nr:putative LPS assembly protein LptD [Ancylomarina sp. 16SWW S1-10-2]MRT93226.1 LPS-assembly protein LptD [Ancylomarina sp. 16SWW S1-10-2]